MAFFLPFAINLTLMIDWIRQPWPWYISGLTIAGTMTLLLFYGKTFGFSSNLRTICSIMGAGKKVKFFDYDWKSERWNLLFLLGSIIGGYISAHWLSSPTPIQISAATVADLAKFNIPF